MKLSLGSLSASHMVSVLSLCTLAACGQPQSEELVDESLPEPIAVLPEDGERTAQAVTPMQLAQFRAELLTAVNNARKVTRKCGTTSYPAAPALVANDKLNTAAQGHAVDMATKNYFSHTGKDGRSPFDRMKAAGYSFSYAGENIAAGNATVAATMTQWLNSAGHCANIMSKNFTQIGFGYDNNSASTYKHYWVQNFGKPL
ncbi:MAG: CAP domain-containing protein [Myxococcales bacterium]|nr:CAP domain-containing protein [Myxococcales bacterium]